MYSVCKSEKDAKFPLVSFFSPHFLIFKSFLPDLKLFKTMLTLFFRKRF